jgi:hypothetical protein
MVAGCIYGPNGREGALLDKLREWREGSTSVLASVSSIAFISAIAGEMPAFLFQAPRHVPSRCASYAATGSQAWRWRNPARSAYGQ